MLAATLNAVAKVWMNHKTQIGGFILAGGESSRMGRDKALLELAGETLIARTANLIASVAGTCAIIGDPNRLVESARFVAAERSVETVGSSGAMRVDEAVQSGDAERWRGAVNKAMAHNMSESGLRVIGDDFPGAGPLGGIATALRVSSAEWSLVVACDLPYLTREWLEFLIGRALRSDADAVVPMNERGAEPLCAMYRKRAESAIRAALERGTRKVTDGLADVRIEFIEPAEWKGFDSDGLLFKNMNSPADYEEAKGRFEPRLKR